MNYVRWLLLVVLLVGCSSPALPVVERPGVFEPQPSETTWPVCSRTVIDALAAPGPAGIAHAAAQGATFMCVADRTWGLPLDLAIRMSPSRLPHAEVLLQYGADPNQRWCAPPRTRHRDAGCVSETGPTPLMWSRRLGLDTFAALLLQYGADATARDAEGRTADDYQAEPTPAGRQRE